MESKNNELGTVIRLTVEGMKYQIVEVLTRREKEVKSAIEEYVNSSEVARDISKEIDVETKRWIGTLVSNALQEAVEKEVGKNKEIKAMVEKSVKENSTVIAEAIFQRFIK